VDLSVTPTSFTIPAQSNATIQVIGGISGTASLTYKAVNYCTYTDYFTVNRAPICSLGYTPNYFGTSCAICPGNNIYTKVFSNACNKQGTCTFSSCTTTAARCICKSPYVGAACQWNPTKESITQITINNKAFKTTLNDVAETIGDVVFVVPSNFVASSDVGGEIIIAAYNSTIPVFQNPFYRPPGSTSATDVGWRFEVDCPDNTYADTTFASPVGVFIPFNPYYINQFDLALSDLYYYDITLSSWQLASTYCSSSQSYYDIDFNNNTVATVFCRPGQYNIFIAPPPPLPANTGNSLNPFPAPGVISGTTPTTGVTGFNPIPPPLPVFTNTQGNLSPAQKFVDYHFGSSSILSYSTLLIAMLIFLF